MCWDLDATQSITSTLAVWLIILLEVALTKKYGYDGDNTIITPNRLTVQKRA